MGLGCLLSYKTNRRRSSLSRAGANFIRWLFHGLCFSTFTKCCATELVPLEETVRFSRQIVLLCVVQNERKVSLQSYLQLSVDSVSHKTFCRIGHSNKKWRRRAEERVDYSTLRAADASIRRILQLIKSLLIEMVLS